MDTDILSGAVVAKLLASCKKTTRDRALNRLNIFLCSPLVSKSVSDEDLLKIWKGLFYSVWHADKLPVQVELIDRLSSILSSLDLALAARYFQSFLITIRREWSGIDHLRLDKFYLLIRRFVNKFFRFLSDNKWDADTVQLMVGVFEKSTLFLVDDKYQSQGVNYHISQVYLDEMIEFLPLSIEITESLIRPFFLAIEISRDKVLIKKIKDNIFDRLLRNGVKYLQIVKRSGDNGEVEVEKEIEKLGKVAFSMQFSKRFFVSASAEGTFQGNRKVLFTLHQGFLKMEKDLETSGVNGLIEDEVEENAIQVEEASVGGSSSMKKKKTKVNKVLSDSCNKSKRKKKSIDYSGSVVDVSAFTSVNEDLQSCEEVNVNALEIEGTVVSKKLKNDLEVDDAMQVDMASVGNSSKKRNSKNASRTPETKLKNDLEVDDAMQVDAASVGNSSKKKKSKNASRTPETKSKNDLEVDDAMQVDTLSVGNSSKKKKSKNASRTPDSKSKNDNKSNDRSIIGVSTPANGNLKATEKMNDGDAEESEVSPHFDEVLMSNLQTQFQKVASEVGMVTPSITIAKKRKRAMSAGTKVNGSNGHYDEDPNVKSESKSAKTVRFSIKNNLVWKPQTPLPPERLRLPPSTIPRGSALKKGIPPGPVRTTPPGGKKAKKNGKNIKSRKITYGLSLTVKRPWK
ncbi:hypothetical protein ZOSMA_58G00270 [Zostera marina]|uniref:Uncharacterized protein n=1 Tax=Zostera marina TaxID=29655 RepID=A0A0K9NX10_ZOSMR|nr:hypothetical protein ZOSMA_58G00270 [Zostera marina]